MYNYFTNKGYLFKGDRFSECPLCGNETSASIQDNKFHCFNTSCPGNRRVFTLDEYISEFDKGWTGPVKMQKKMVKHENLYKSIDLNSELYEYAIKFFSEQLFKNPFDLEYQKEKRGHTETTLRKLQVGVVRNSSALRDRLLNMDYDIEDIIDSGLFKELDTGSIVCHFREGQFTYPIYSDNRVKNIKSKPGKDAPKDEVGYYISSAMAGNDYPKIFGVSGIENDEVWLVEGENDLLSLYDRGIENVVALLGTISRTQYDWLKKKNKNYILAFDNDEAGEKYRQRIVQTLINKKGDNIKMAWYDSSDPDEHIQLGRDFNILPMTKNTISKYLFYDDICSLNNDYCLLDINGQMRMVDKVNRTSWYDKTNFSLKEANRFHVFNEWSMEAEHLNGVTTDFTTTHYKSDSSLNLFSGFNITGKEDNEKIPYHWLNFVKEVICAGNQVYYTYVLDWLSDMFQNPDKATAISLVIYGKEQGTGKNSFVDMIRNIIGEKHSATVQDINDVSTWNGVLEGKLLIQFDESIYGKSGKETSALKRIIGNDKIMIREKYKPQYETKNSIRFIITSNSDTPVGMEKDNRRFFPLKPDPKYIDEKAKRPTKEGEVFYKNMRSEILDQDYAIGLYHYLLNREISKGYSRFYVLKSTYEQDMYKNLRPEYEEWLELIYTGEISEKWNPTLEEITSSDFKVNYKEVEKVETSVIYEKYLGWLRTISGAHTEKLSQYAFTRKLVSLGFEKKRARLPNQDKPKHVFIMSAFKKVLSDMFGQDQGESKESSTDQSEEPPVSSEPKIDITSAEQAKKVLSEILGV
jgi:5S rRNA maturation endonuclease (ribonuclease M5)